MFTTGSKLFLGATALSTGAAIVVAITMGGSVGFMATVGLISLAVIFGFLAGIDLFVRDGNIPPMEPGVERTAPAAQPPVGRSLWPVVAAFGVSGIVVGAVSKPVVFKVSIVVLFAAIVEWMVQGWSERASGDPGYNESLRRRILHPLEFPILGALALGLVLYSFSRIMLSASKEAALVLFIVFGALVLGIATVFAVKRGVGKATTAGVLGVIAVGLVGAGVVSAVSGQRDIEEHPPLSRGVCLEEVGEEEMHHADEDANRNVYAQASVFAHVELNEDGDLVAYVSGLKGSDQAVTDTLTIPRSSTVTLVFRNNAADGEHGEGHRLTARLGTFGDAQEIVDCTARVEEGHEGFLALHAPKTNEASSTELELIVPDMPGKTITLTVP
ncbi:MAG TPA: hypothetical protein VMS14_02445 [Ilumatobacteraceae bacterium]|nr:hypothetical protein [Ilumatobacteraceae bacterium]